MALTSQYLKVYSLVYAVQLLLPLTSGSALGISISLCDPGPCASNAICQVFDKMLAKVMEMEITIHKLNSEFCRFCWKLIVNHVGRSIFMYKRGVFGAY